MCSFIVSTCISSLTWYRKKDIEALKIGFISFNLSSLDKGCCRFERFRPALSTIVARNEMRK